MRRSFDNLANAYCALERLLFGQKLNQSRHHGLTVLEPDMPQRALILGDGDGRFSYYALRKSPNLQIDSIERSSKMRDLAQSRIQKLGASFENRHQYISTDARSFSFPNSEYDIVVVQYFLDCFHTTDANSFIENFARTLKPNGKLVYTDFSIPKKRIVRWIAKGIVKCLYSFFRLTTDIEASHLPSIVWPHSLKLTSKKSLLKGIITSEIRARSLD